MEQIREFLVAAPSVVPLLVVALVAAAGLARPLGRGGLGTASAGLLVAAVGFVLAVTLAPVPPFVASNGCDLDLSVAPNLQSLLDPSQASLNVVLFIPVGFAIGLVTDKRW